MFSKFIFLFRLFFPSWKFFDESSYLYYLKYRFACENEDISQIEWQLCPPKLNRNFMQIVLNPDGNIALACESTLQHFYSDLYESQSSNNSIVLVELTSYKNLQNLVEFYADKFDKDFCYYQFKIAIMNGIEEEDIMVSKVHSRDLYVA